jgi:hypothetical protein
MKITLAVTAALLGIVVLLWQQRSTCDVRTGNIDATVNIVCQDHWSGRLSVRPVRLFEQGKPIHTTIDPATELR